MTRITNSNPLSLSNLGRGELINRFDTAMADALSNIKDRSTPAAKPRKIIIEVAITPSPDRDGADIQIAVTKKLPASEPYVSQIIISEDIDGQIIAHESVSASDQDKLDNI